MTSKVPGTASSMSEWKEGSASPRSCLRVALGHREGGGGDVGGAHLETRDGALDRDGDAARAGADVVDALQPGIAAHDAEDLFHQELGVGPGHEDPLIDVELQAVELLDVADVGNRDAFAALIDESAKARLRFGADGIRHGGEQLLLCRGKGVGEEHEGIQEGRFDFSEEECVVALREQGPNGHVVSVSADSCACRRSASMNSTISPFITASSLYRVRLMR